MYVIFYYSIKVVYSIIFEIEKFNFTMTFANASQNEFSSDSSKSSPTSLTAWPFIEAKKVIERSRCIKKSEIVLETGYGPSGLPHMGTLGEVARTFMVFYAIKYLDPSLKVRLISFSDDMDGMRKVPDNVPNQELLLQHIDKPLTQVPDPFELYDSFGDYNNKMLISFLDSFSMNVEYMTATHCYKSGIFNDALLKVLKHHKEILDIMLPTLGEERRENYSPFLPISPKSGKVLQVRIEKYLVDEGCIEFFDEDGTLTKISVLNGNCKLQWKVDWGMRWHALGVDYEMYGKDLIDSQVLSYKICRLLGSEPPVGCLCEHFLDANGAKISKSKGNGLSVNDWLKYAPRHSLIYFLFKSPQRAKKLSFDIIPTIVDEYLGLLEGFSSQSEVERLNNPVYHVHFGSPVKFSSNGLSFSLILNLVNVCNAENIDILKSYLARYLGDSSNIDVDLLQEMLTAAMHYYKDFVLPKKNYRVPTNEEKDMLVHFGKALQKNLNATAEDLQKASYEVGKKFMANDLKGWFGLIYGVLLGQSSGPRIGNFIYLYGVENFVNLILQKVA